MTKFFVKKMHLKIKYAGAKMIFKISTRFEKYVLS